MPRFFLHVYNSTGFVEDEEGQEMSGRGEARAAAVEGIRSLLAEEVLKGAIDFRGRVEIFEGPERVAVVPFEEAVAVLRDGGGE